MAGAFFFVCVKHRKAKLPRRSSSRLPVQLRRIERFLECEKIVVECIVNARANMKNVFFVFILPAPCRLLRLVKCLG